jgi:undecaprenyl pyrophosphate synthase
LLIKKNKELQSKILKKIFIPLAFPDPDILIRTGDQKELVIFCCGK